jgi:hypothetical protein
MNNLCLGEGMVGRREGGVWRGFLAGLCREKVKRHPQALIGGVDWGPDSPTNSRGKRSERNTKNLAFSLDLIYKYSIEFDTFYYFIIGMIKGYLNK